MKAHQALAELKGVGGIIPNQNILINSLSLQEAKESSAIESIITTHDELYKSEVLARGFWSLDTKEVRSYAESLRKGYKTVKKTGLLTNNNILEIQETLGASSAGFRKTSNHNNNQKHCNNNSLQIRTHSINALNSYIF